MANRIHIVSLFAAFSAIIVVGQSAPPALSTPIISPDQTRSLVRQVLIELAIHEKIPAAPSIDTVGARTVTGRVLPSFPAGDSAPGSAPLVTPVLSNEGTSVRRATTKDQTGRPRVPASLSMLSRRLTGSLYPTPSLSGLEGTGDLPVVSPYSILLGNASKTSLQQTAVPPKGNRTESRRLRSIPLLQERLEASDQQTQASRKEGDK